MRLVSKEIKTSTKIYKGFHQGKKTDREIIARACGFQEGEAVATAEMVFENDSNIYQLTMAYEAQGEQKLLEVDDMKKKAEKINVDLNKLESAYSNAMSNKASTAEEVLILSDFFDAFSEVFSRQCWYEAIVTLTLKNKEGETKVIIDGHSESELGIHEVLSSVQDIHDKHKEEDNNIELLENFLDSLTD